MNHPYPYRSWSVLLLGSNGRIIQFRRFKILVWIGVVLFAVAVGEAVYFYYRHHSQTLALTETIRQTEKLEQELAKTQEEREALLVRLALLEGRPVAEAGAEGLHGETSPDLSGGSPKEIIDPPESASTAAGSDKADSEPASGSQSLDKTPVSQDDQEELLAVVPAAESDPGIPDPSVDSAGDSTGWAAISHFKSTPLPDVAQLKIAYRIKNGTRAQGKLRGYTYVLLEGDVDGVAHFVVVPGGLTASEPPPLQTKGYDFAVLNYLTIRLTAEGIQDYNWIRQATVYVCDVNGTLLLRERLPLTIG